MKKNMSQSQSQENQRRGERFAAIFTIGVIFVMAVAIYLIFFASRPDEQRSQSNEMSVTIRYLDSKDGSEVAPSQTLQFAIGESFNLKHPFESDTDEAETTGDLEIIDVTSAKESTGDDWYEMINAVSLYPEWIRTEIEPGGYYYESNIAEGDPELTFMSYSEPGPDFIKVTPSLSDSEPQEILDVEQSYMLRVIVGHESDEPVENVEASLECCWLFEDRIRFMVKITYGESSIIYAEDVQVAEYDGHYRIYDTPKADLFTLDSRRTFGGPSGDVLCGYAIPVSSDEDGVALLGGAENAREICISLILVRIPTKSEPYAPTPRPNIGRIP